MNKVCYLCNSTNLKELDGIVRDKPEIKILKCGNCSLVFLESFEHIDDNHYEDSKMFDDVDNKKKEIHLKENKIDNKRREVFIKNNFPENLSILDFGCGNGDFLNLIESYTNLTHGLEKDINYFKKFSHLENIKLYSDIPVLQKYDIITLFHVLEHIKNPIETLKQLSQHLTATGKIVIEVPNSNDALISLYDNKQFKRFTYWSNHLYLYNNENLKSLLEKSDLKINMATQVQRYTLANHLYWLSNGKPGGHNLWSFLNDKQMDKRYEIKLNKQGMCDTIIMIVSKFAKEV